MIPHNKPTLGSREVSAVSRVINSGWVAQGKEVSQFEDEISRLESILINSLFIIFSIFTFVI